MVMESFFELSKGIVLLLNSFFQDSAVVSASKFMSFRFQVLPTDKLGSDVVVAAFNKEIDI